MTTFTSEDREMAAKHDGIESPHNACCYRDQCRQQQAEIEALKAELEHMRSFFGCDPAYYGMTYDAKKHGAEQ